MKKKIFIITGETSGDLLAYNIFKNIDFDKYEISGIIGNNLEKLNIYKLFSNSEITFFGITEVLKNIYHIKKKINETVHFIEKFGPDIVFSVDSPDFVFQVSKKIRSNNKIKTKFYHFVAPTIWAWREKRGKKIRKLLDKVYLLFDFEQDIFSKYKINYKFVGHPFFDDFDPQYSNHLNNSKLISFCPGSRASEVKRFMPIFKDIIINLSNNYQYHFGFTEKFKDLVKKNLKDISGEIIIETNENKKNEHYKNSLVTIAKSGTITLNLCKAQTPIITIYKFSFLNYLMIKPFVKSKYANIINVMADKEVIPEFIQFDCTSTKILEKIKYIINHQSEAENMIKSYNSVLKRISNKNTNIEILNDLEKSLS